MRPPGDGGERLESATAELVEREAVRILLIDQTGAVLLAHYITPDTGDDFWCTPGGALDPGEDHVAAATRELLEELGIEIAAAELGPVIAHREHRFISTFGTDRLRRFHQVERFHALARARFTPAPARLGEFESLALREYRWWTVAELRATAEDISPRRLPWLLELMAGTVITTPVDLGE